MTDDPTASNETTLCCSFCGVPRSPDTPLIAGNDGHICEACVKLAHQVVHGWGRYRQKQRPELKTPQAIKAFLDEFIIGQEEAKRTLSVAVFNHYMRLLSQAPSHQLPDGSELHGVELEKSNVLMTGPSGTGKTLLVKTLARIIGVPFVAGDATSLTQAGYVGQDVDSLIKRLLESADGDASRAEWGIVYIDEIDKLARTGDGAAAVRDVSGEGVQQALLKMIEGTEVRVSKPGQREGHGEDLVVDTSQILFMVGGAFPRLGDLVARRLQSRDTGIGFNAPVQQDQPTLSGDELLAALQPDDLQAFGLIPEFIGRLPVITFLRELDADSLRRILVEPRNALTRQYRQLFEYQRVELVFTDEALTHMAEDAASRGTGARGLRSVLENLLRDVMFDMPSIPRLRRCVVDTEWDDSGDRALVVRQELGEPREVLPGTDTPATTEAATSRTECPVANMVG